MSVPNAAAGGAADQDPAPLVSIIVPCYVRTAHDERLLDETLATVRAQTRQDYELILVDDGSPRPVRERPGEGRVRLLRQANAGSAMARNAGIAVSRGDYMVFLDADDHLLPQALEVGLSHLAAHPECGFAIGPREEMTHEGQPVPWQVPAPPAGGEIYTPLLNFDWYIIPPSSAIFRRSAVLAVGGFRNPWGADDLDFYLRIARANLAWCYQSPPVTRYRRYSTSSSRDGERMLRSIRTVYERQRPVVEGSPADERAWHAGLGRLTGIFVDCLVENIEDRTRAGNWRGAARSARLLARENPRKLVATLTRMMTGRRRATV
jgi:glycosyltransferase involved in cell wall biosynthesis